MSEVTLDVYVKMTFSLCELPNSSNKKYIAFDGFRNVLQSYSRFLSAIIVGPTS